MQTNTESLASLDKMRVGTEEVESRSCKETFEEDHAAQQDVSREETLITQESKRRGLVWKGYQ